MKSYQEVHMICFEDIKGFIHKSTDKAAELPLEGLPVTVVLWIPHLCDTQVGDVTLRRVNGEDIAVRESHRFSLSWP